MAANQTAVNKGFYDDSGDCSAVAQTYETGCGIIFEREGEMGILCE